MVNYNIIKQIIELTYLGVILTSDGATNKGVKKENKLLKPTG